MAGTYVLQLGDSLTAADAVPLGDGTQSFIPLQQVSGGGGTFVPGGISFDQLARGFTPGQPGSQQPPGTRAIRMGLLFTATDVNTIEQYWRNVQTKLEEARKAWGILGRGTRVVYRHQPAGETTASLWDVANGVEYYGYLGLVDGTLMKGAILTLYVARYGRGPVQNYAAQPTATNGAAACVFLQHGVPGDVDALVYTQVKDVSTGGLVIVRFTLGRRSVNTTLAATDFTGLYKCVSVSPGTDTTDGGGNYTGGHFSRITATTAWRDLAKVVQPAGAYQTGALYFKLRLRESSVPLTMPYGPTATGSGAGGTLTEGTYTAFLTTADAGNTESLPLAMPAAVVPLKSTAAFFGAESGDTAGLTLTVSGSGNNMQASFNATAAAARTGGVPSLLGFRASAAGGGRMVAAVAVPGAGTVICSRVDMRVNTDSGAASTTVYTQIPLIGSGSSPAVSLFNAGSGWFLANAAVSNLTAISVPDGDWCKLTVIATWTGALESCQVYINDVSVYGPANISVTQQTSVCLGAGAIGAGTSLSVDFDNWQIDTALIGANTGSIAYTWQPGLGGSKYFLYPSRNGGTFSQISIAALATSSYTLTSNTAGTANTNPPSTAPALADALFRVGVALDAATLTNSNFTWARPRPSVVANSQWEVITIGPLWPPQLPFQSGTAAPNYQFRVQGKSGSTNTPTLDVDYLLALPADEYEDVCTVAMPGGTIPSAGQYRLDCRYDELPQCDVVAASDGVTVIGKALVSGRWRYAPGDQIVVTDYEVQGPVNNLPISDVLNAKAVYGQGGVQVTPRYDHAIGYQPYLSDTFTRTNSLSALGLADTGQSYTVTGGTFGVSTNRFYVNTVTSTNKAFAYIDAAGTDTTPQNGVLRATLVTAAAGLSYLVFRIADAANWYAVQYGPTQGLTLVQCAAGTITTVASNAHNALANDVLAVTLAGTACSVAVNGTTLITAASVPNNPTAAAYGLGGNNAATETWDTWSVGSG